ncbi:MAG TPA: hypothetical protein VFZ18_03745, partial [Longimicrobiaceae bacterium]
TACAPPSGCADWLSCGGAERIQREGRKDGTERRKGFLPHPQLLVIGVQSDGVSGVFAPCRCFFAPLR